MSKPKYQIGDEVWVIIGGKIKNVRVVKIIQEMQETTDGKTENIRYMVQREIKQPLATFVELCGLYDEDDLFPAKEELIASL